MRTESHFAGSGGGGDMGSQIIQRGRFSVSVRPEVIPDHNPSSWPPPRSSFSLVPLFPVCYLLCVR